MNAMKAMVVAVGLLLAATPAGAMTGQEFLQAYDRSASDQAAVLRPLVRQFVRRATTTFLTGSIWPLWRVR
jgi:hypothetical protein